MTEPLGVRKTSLYDASFTVTIAAALASVVSLVALVVITRSPTLSSMTNGAFLITTSTVGVLTFTAFIIGLVVTYRQKKYFYKEAEVTECPGSDYEYFSCDEDEAPMTAAVLVPGDGQARADSPPPILENGTPTTPPVTAAVLAPGDDQERVDSPPLILANRTPVTAALEAAAEEDSNIDILFPEDQLTAEEVKTRFQERVLEPRVNELHQMLQALFSQADIAEADIEGKVADIRKAVLQDIKEVLELAAISEKSARNELLRILCHSCDAISAIAPNALIYKLNGTVMTALSIAPEGPITRRMDPRQFVAIRNVAPKEIKGVIDEAFNHDPLKDYKGKQTHTIILSLIPMLTDFAVVYAHQHKDAWFPIFNGQRDKSSREAIVAIRDAFLAL